MPSMVEPKPAGSKGALNAPPTGNDRLVALLALGAWVAIMILATCSGNRSQARI